MGAGMRDVAVVSFARRVEPLFELDEGEMLAPCIAEALSAAKLERRDVGFTVSGSCDYLGGRPFSFVTTLDAVGAWPPIRESHVEMDGAWALYEAWVALQHGDIDVALVYAFGRSTQGDLAEILGAQLDPYTVAPLGIDATSMAALQARAMLDVLRANLEGVTFESPVVGLRVRALRLEEAGEALPLFRSVDDLDPQTIAVTLARLEAALGEPAQQARNVRAYALEEQFAYSPFGMPAISASFETLAAPDTLADTVRPQLQLLEVREIAVRMAAGAPAFVGSPLRHGSGQALRAVLECAGPWRIEENWFATPLVRDEYDVLLDGGALYRIYRQGERWYLRGSYD